MARRRVTAFATAETLAELRRVVDEIGFETLHSPHSILDWYYGAAKLIFPVPLGKQRSRNLNDGPDLACALASGAEVVVSCDKGLLALGRPFGIEIITPRELLSGLVRRG